MHPKIKTSITNYLYVSIYLARHCLKVSKKIISAQFILSLLTFFIQILFSILLVGLFGGNVEKYLPASIPAQDIIPSLTAQNFGYVIGAFLIIRAVIGFMRRRLDYKLRYKMEVHFSQLFINLLSTPPLDTAQEIYRRKLRDQGPTIMKMGSHQMAIACTLIARSIVQAPFIIVYSVLLFVLFKAELLRSSIPLFLAALVSILLFSRLSRLSWAYMDSIKPAVKERSELWKQMPIRKWDKAMPLNQFSDISKGKSGKQLTHFYARHFQSANTSLFVNIFFAVAMATAFVVFANRVIAGEATWSEVIILIAVSQLLLASIGIMAGSFLLISRNFAGIKQFVDQCEMMAKPQVDDGDSMDRLVDIPSQAKRLIVLNLGHKRRAIADVMPSVEAAWGRDRENFVTGKDFIRPPFPRLDEDLAALGKNLGSDQILSLQAIRFMFKPERVERLFNVLGEENLVLYCTEIEQLDVYETIPYEHLVIIEDTEILDVIARQNPEKEMKIRKWVEWHREVNSIASNTVSDLDYEDILEF